MNKIKVLILNIFLLLLLCFSIIKNTHAQIVINEICSNNGAVILDENGDASDWFELYNKGTVPVSLSGYAIANDSAPKWFFPHTTMLQGSFLLVFASGKDRKIGEPHTSFKISKSGDKLSLFDASGNKTNEMQCGALQLNHSTGLFPNGSDSLQAVFVVPTPRASNNLSTAYTGYAESPVFSIDGGFYQG